MQTVHHAGRIESAWTSELIPGGKRKQFIGGAREAIAERSGYACPPV
jgi:hypothetical protein